MYIKLSLRDVNKATDTTTGILHLKALGLLQYSPDTLDTRE